jgi:hypothetical protein
LTSRVEGRIEFGYDYDFYKGKVAILTRAGLGLIFSGSGFILWDWTFSGLKKITK